MNEQDVLMNVKTVHLDLAHRIQAACAEERDEDISKELKKCKRLWHEDQDTGGFFIALFEQTSGNLKEEKPLDGPFKSPPPNGKNSVVPVAKELESSVCGAYGLPTDTYSCWSRGKRLNLAPRVVLDHLWSTPCPARRGDMWPGSTFHPLMVTHVGMPAFTEKKGSWRIRQEAIPQVGSKINSMITHIGYDVFNDILSGWEPLVEEFITKTGKTPPERGAWLMMCGTPIGQEILSVWIGARVTMMVNQHEQNVLKVKHGLMAWSDVR